VSNYLLAPLNRVATVMTDTSEAIRKERTKIHKEEVGTESIGQGSAEVALVFIKPLLHSQLVTISQLYARDALEHLDILVCVGTDRSATIFHCERNVRSTNTIIELEKFLYGIILPLAGKATTATELCELEVVEFIAGEAEDFVIETLTSRLNENEVVILHAEIDLIDDFEKVNLKERNGEERTTYFNAKFTLARLVAYEIAIDISTKRPPKTEELNIVGLDKTERTEISQLFVSESECAEMVYLCVDFVAHRDCEFHVLIATLEEIFSVEVGVLVEHYLSHCKFV
jgi:hypothetical protein